MGTAPRRSERAAATWRGGDQLVVVARNDDRLQVLRP